MANYTANKAKMRTGQVDPLTLLNANNSPESNQVRFVSPGGNGANAGPAQGKAQMTANTEGTGKEGVQTAIALAKKRKLGVKLPANF